MNTYKEELERFEDMIMQDPAQLSLFNSNLHPIGVWIPVRSLKIEDYENIGEVIGFNPAWVHPDFNENGLRICCWTGGGWNSAKWCSYHDIYEDVYSGDTEGSEVNLVPLFIAPLPAIHPRFKVLVDRYTIEKNFE